MPSTANGASPVSSSGGSLTLPKAQIINLDKGGEIIECMFNPKEYSMSKKVNWGPPTSGGGANSNSGTNVPKQQYNGGQPATLTMQLFFDTYVGARGSRDVRTEYTSKIWTLTKVDPHIQDNKTT